MAAYDYKIGTTAVGMVTLTSLGITAPMTEYSIAVDSVTLGDGSEKGVGSPTAIWHWGFLTGTQRASLRTYCTGTSATVYIRTKKDDNTYDNFFAILVWPLREQRVAGRVVDFTIQLRELIAI